MDTEISTYAGTPCAPWAGSINRQGYGTRGGKLAHRLAWAAEHGSIPDGSTIDHVCHDPNICRLGQACPHRRCVNVDHMKLVSASENASRGSRRAALVQECPAGHPYSGKNLAVYSGARHCRQCRRDKGESRRARQRAERCRTRGHERDERTAADGRRYCVICQQAHGQRTSPPRTRTPAGQYASGEEAT